MNRIYVFSSTGTSLQIANDISENLENTEIISIPKLMKQDNWAITGDTIGFVFPCYYGTMPKLVAQFITGAEKIETVYTYCVATAGGDPGYSLKHLKEALITRGSDLHYGRKIVIASNYMNGWYYNLIQPKKEILEQKVNDAREKCHEIARDINLSVKMIEKAHFLNYLLPQVISPSRYIRDTRAWDSEFTVAENCNSCGICAKACPVDNITMKEGKPTFNRNCQRCMSCIQFCPESAFLIEGKPMNKPKYLHPTIKIRDMISFNS